MKTCGLVRSCLLSVMMAAIGVTVAVAQTAVETAVETAATPETGTCHMVMVPDADVSGDGVISLDEFRLIYVDLIHARMVAAYQALDANGDGVTTQAEMENRIGAIAWQFDPVDGIRTVGDCRG